MEKEKLQLMMKAYHQHHQHKTSCVIMCEKGWRHCDVWTCMADNRTTSQVFTDDATADRMHSDVYRCYSYIQMLEN